MRNKSILISLFLIHHLQGSLSQINNTSIDQLENTTTITTEDSIVEDKLEKVQNHSNNAGNIIEDIVAK
ncbi:MAG: hypothetical protein ACR2F1_07415 [Nitrososphaeraceae archaeon]